MPTGAYVQYSRTKPDGSVGTGATFSADDLANQQSLSDAIAMLRSDGFLMSRSGGTSSQPAVLLFTKGTLVFRLTLTWTAFTVTTILYEWSTDTGGTWATVGTQVNTVSSDAITATTGSGGLSTILFEVWGKVLRVVSDIAAHIAAVGTAVHGLGTAAVANLASMALTGTSTLDGTGGVGQTTAPPVDATRVREKFNDYGAIAGGGTVTLQLDLYAAFAFTAPVSTANFTIAVSGAPTAGKFQAWQLEIIGGQRTGGGAITYPANTKWVGTVAAKPGDGTLETGSGRNLFVFSTRDAGTRLELTHLGIGG